MFYVTTGLKGEKVGPMMLRSNLLVNIWVGGMFVSIMAQNDE